MRMRRGLSSSCLGGLVVLVTLGGRFFYDVEDVVVDGGCVKQVRVVTFIVVVFLSS